MHINYATPSAIPSSSSEASKKGKERERAIIDLRLGSSSSSDGLTNEKASTTTLQSHQVTAKASPAEETTTTIKENSRRAITKENVAEMEGLRQRIKGLSAMAGNSDDDGGPPPTYAETVNEYLLDPIQQFSAFPPITLRNAQREFRLAIEKSLGVLVARRLFEAGCSLVEELQGGNESFRKDSKKR